MSDKDWIQTRSGRKFYPLDPNPDDIDIDDIAWALAHLNRYTGHASRAISVGLHSIMMAEQCPPEHQLAGLLHDASEAYTNDVSRPLKQMAEMKSFRAAEARLQSAILRKFGLPAKLPDCVKHADDLCLANEARQLMQPLHPDWVEWLDKIPRIKVVIPDWSAKTVYRIFLHEYRKLSRKL